MNIVMISPGYPAEMAFFARGLAAAGASVIGIGDQPPSAVPPVAREAMAHYLQVGSLAAGDGRRAPRVMRRSRRNHDSAIRAIPLSIPFASRSQDRQASDGAESRDANSAARAGSG